jgi:Uma2 family endonuclease
MDRIAAEIAGLGMRATGYCFDPARVIDALAVEFGEELIVRGEDAAQARVDYMREHGSAGALASVQSDARHRGPILGFGFRSAPAIRGRAERYVVDLISEVPIPERIASGFLFALRELPFEGFRTARRKGSAEAPVVGDVAWPVAELFPRQGDWLEEDYLRLPGNRRVELIDGWLELQPFPTRTHHDVLGELFMTFSGDLRGRGVLLIAPFPVRLRERTFRTPDICFKRKDRSKEERFWDGADLVVEVVSDDDPDRDLVVKRAEYAAAGIPEYWIADPRDRTLTVLTLDPGAAEYRQAGRYGEGQTARSVLLDGLTVDVTKAFAAE